MIQIEIVYTTQQQQKLISCVIAEGLTVEEAILQSKVLEHFPEVKLVDHKVGIFGKIVPLSHILADGDRVEIYRPLLIDPKQARRLKK